jgi:hypothetical protein
MKNTTKVFLIAAMALTTFASCKDKKDDGPTTTNPAAPGVTTCQVNGQTWTSDQAGKYSATDSLPGCEALLNGDTMTFISTRFSDNSAILAQLVLTPARVGTYSGSTSADAGMFYLSKFDETTLFQSFLLYTTSYSFTISDWNASAKKFSGTFNITMTSNTGGSNITVTNGKCTNVPYVLE